jgi:TAG lipase/steryl ester hydrolase/phospholipase A2/LPA acyltransferase
MRRLKRSAERAAASQSYGPTIRLCPSRRIPSWNLIARENSTGSLEDEMLTSPTVTSQAAGGTAGLSNRNHHLQHSIHDSSDSESESIELNSWTRSGGPLMRTASANKFISFVQNLEIDTEFRIASPRGGESDTVTPNNFLASHPLGREPVENHTRPVTPGRISSNSGSEHHDTTVPRSPFGISTSIMVPEGDLLQPEKMGNGILFNVVRRDTLLASTSGVDPRGYSHEVDVETVPTEHLYGASDDDDVESKDVNEAASDPGVYMSSENVGHQRCSLAGNLDSSASIDRQAEISTTRSGAPSLFDICVEIPPAPMTTKSSIPDEHVSESRLETAKTECPDGNSTTGNDEVESSSASGESSNLFQTAETRQQHQVDTGSVDSYDVPVSENDLSIISSDKPVSMSSGQAESITYGRNEAE